jgi:uncharacterized RDD family membrane protein YckC
MAQQVAPAPQYAGFWIRFFAYIVDAIIIGVVGGIINAVASPLGSITVVYLPIMWAWKGQTVGMMLLGIKIVRAEDGGPITPVTAIIRWIGLFISFLAIFIGVIWVAFEPRKRGWHDMMANTVVIHA